jgi:putative hydrolase
MKFLGDYHTHTVYSHGKGSVEDNVRAALNKGLKEIAIADHGMGHISYGIKRSKIKKLRKEIDSVQKKYPEIKILMGIETNLTSLEGDIDLPDEYRDYFDIVLMGFHKAVWPRDLKSAYYLFFKNILAPIIPGLGRRLRDMNTQAMTRAVERHKIDVITHPGAKINIDTRLLAQKAAARGTLLEINASHGYMKEEYVQAAKEQGAKFIINSDAHKPRDVGNFAKAIDIVKRTGLKKEDIYNML